MAYEWEFNGINDYHRMQFLPPKEGEKGSTLIPMDDEMTDLQKELSDELKAAFPEYLNSLQLRDESGELLKLDADGRGNFLEYVKAGIIASAQKEEDRLAAGGAVDALVGAKYEGIRHMTANTAPAPQKAELSRSPTARWRLWIGMPLSVSAHK